MQKWPTLKGRLNSAPKSEKQALLQLKSSIGLNEFGEKRLKFLQINPNKMKKPIKSKKPSKKSLYPSREIIEKKLLVVDNNNNKFLLIDNDSHPEVFSDKYSLDPTWTELENLGFNWEMKTLSYSDYQKIYKECYIPSDDFTVNHIYNCDGYYDYSIVEYKTIDAKYDEKLKKFENRFVEYELAIKNYESELIKYNEYKKQEKIAKMEKQLKKLKSS